MGEHDSQLPCRGTAILVIRLNRLAAEHGNEHVVKRVMQGMEQFKVTFQKRSDSVWPNLDVRRDGKGISQRSRQWRSGGFGGSFPTFSCFSNLFRCARRLQYNSVTHTG